MSSFSVSAGILPMPLSLRDLEEMVTEHGILVAHSAFNSWSIRLIADELTYAHQLILMNKYVYAIQIRKLWHRLLTELQQHCQ